MLSSTTTARTFPRGTTASTPRTPPTTKKIDSFISELEGDSWVCSMNLPNSPCDRLEAGFSQGNGAPRSDGPETESLIRLSRGSSNEDDDIVPFSIILNNIEKKYSQEK